MTKAQKFKIRLLRDKKLTGLFKFMSIHKIKLSITMVAKSKMDCHYYNIRRKTICLFVEGESYQDVFIAFLHEFRHSYHHMTQKFKPYYSTNRRKKFALITAISAELDCDKFAYRVSKLMYPRWNNYPEQFPYLFNICDEDVSIFENLYRDYKNWNKIYN